MIDPTGLVRPVVPAPTHGEAALVPDHLSGDLEADPLEPYGHLRGMDPGVPDVADGQAGHQGEGVRPVDPGVTRDRRVAMALRPPVGAPGRSRGIVPTKVGSVCR